MFTEFYATLFKRQLTIIYLQLAYKHHAMQNIRSVSQNVATFKVYTILR